MNKATVPGDASWHERQKSPETGSDRVCRSSLVVFGVALMAVGVKAGELAYSEDVWGIVNKSSPLNSCATALINCF